MAKKKKDVLMVSEAGKTIVEKVNTCYANLLGNSLDDAISLGDALKSFKDLPEVKGIFKSCFGRGGLISRFSHKQATKYIKISDEKDWCKGILDSALYPPTSVNGWLDVIRKNQLDPNLVTGYLTQCELNLVDYEFNRLTASEDVSKTKAIESTIKGLQHIEPKVSTKTKEAALRIRISKESKRLDDMLDAISESKMLIETMQSQLDGLNSSKKKDLTKK